MLRRPLARALTGGVVAVLVAVVPASLPHSVAGPAATAAGPVGDAGARVEERARRSFDALPLAFEANRGQVDARAKYVARGERFTLFLTQEGAVFDLQPPDAGPASRPPARAVAVALDPVGAEPAPRVVGRHRRDATSSYFVGDDASRWRRGVPTFGRVRYRDLYPGVDMVFRGTRSGAEYDFVVAPGSDPDRIGYRLRGADVLRIEDGDLVAGTAVGDFVHRAPVAYQVVDGRRQAVEARFRLVDGVVGFDLGSYDPHLPLVIDPETDLEYSTYLGGSGADLGRAVAVEDGDAYITGYTGSTDFPSTTGPHDLGTGVDVFVTRISPDGGGSADLVSSTYLGGAANHDGGLDLVVDGGDVYVSGYTRSSDFPTTPGALDGSFNGVWDAFVARLSLEPAGAADLVYSTFLGGGSIDIAHGIAVDGGDVYLTGDVESPEFPTTAGAFDGSMGGLSDGFVTRISPDGAGAADLVYSTFVGGSGIDSGWAITVDGGDAYLTGSTWDAPDFPTTAGAFDRTLGGEEDAFLTRISPDGAGAADLVYSTYLGGPSWDDADRLTVADGDAYIVGTTRSARFPTTAGAYDRTYNGDTDGFVARLSPDGAGAADLRYSTFLGGGKEDWVNGIVVEDGVAYLCGGTESAGFPTTTAAYDRSYGGAVDAVVARLALRSGGKGDLEYSTFLGGSGWDTAYQIVEVQGTAYVAGWTDSDDLPTTDGSYDRAVDADDAFLVRMPVPDTSFQPDAWIRRDGGPHKGKDVYNLTGRHQTTSARTQRGRRQVFWVTAQNDDDLSDRLRITGPAGSRHWVVRYHRRGTDITGQVTGPGYRTRSLPTGGRLAIKVTVKPTAGARLGAARSVRVLVSSVGNRVFKDAVRARVLVER